VFIVIEWLDKNYTDIMLAMNERFDVATFSKREEAEQHARENCAFRTKVVEI